MKKVTITINSEVYEIQDLGEQQLSSTHLRCPYLHCIMLHPAFIREYLGELSLHDGFDIACLVVDDGPGARSALIKRHYVFFHAAILSKQKAT